MIPTTSDLIAQLYEELARRDKPLPITIGAQGEIAGRGCDFNSTMDYSCVFAHPEGSLEIGYDCPTRRAVFCKAPDAFSRLPYEQQAAAIFEEAANIGIPLDEHEPPWLWHARGATREHALTKWLDERFGGDGDQVSEQEFLWSLSGVGEHLPGFAILDRLPEPEARQLDMRVVDIGGPASSVTAVVVGCPEPDLDDALRRNNLPFEVVRDGQ